MNEYVKPERATYEMVETFKRAWEAANLRHDPSDPPGTRTNAGLEAILALLPGRTEAEVKAEAFREAAEELRRGDHRLGKAKGPNNRPAYVWLRDRANELDPDA